MVIISHKRLKLTSISMKPFPHVISTSSPYYNYTRTIGPNVFRTSVHIINIIIHLFQDRTLSRKLSKFIKI